MIVSLGMQETMVLERVDCEKAIEASVVGRKWGRSKVEVIVKLERRGGMNLTR